MRRFLAVVCLLLLAVPTALAEAPGKGRLWRIERPGLAPSWLFGTIHSSAPAVLALPGSVQRALGESQIVVGEVDTTRVNSGLFMASALLPAGASLADYLSPELYARTLEAVAPLGLAPAVADRLEVWFLGLMLSIDPAEFERQRQGKTVLDDWLQREGRRQGKTIVGLEELAEQIALFAGLSEPAQVALLRSALDFPGLITGINTTLTALWFDGDLPSMWRQFRVSLLASGPELRRHMTYDVVLSRNHRMAERLAPILTLGGVFVAVGALHLAGEEGLIVLLQQQGWTVTRAD